MGKLACWGRGIFTVRILIENRLSKSVGQWREGSLVGWAVGYWRAA